MYSLPKESLLDRQFPDEAKTRPSAEELEKNAVVALHYGHPLILDGLRPSAPNYVPIGMMLCREARPIADTKISNFMNSEKANRHGVILVSFGTVLKLSQVGSVHFQIFCFSKLDKIASKLWIQMTQSIKK